MSGESLAALAALLDSEPERWSAVLQRLGGRALAPQQGFDRLLVLERLPGLYLYPHQRAAVRRVLVELHGRALLADDVGLGKTVEAGAILKEYLLRGLVHTFLILTPASLTRQWQRELEGKFAIRAVVNDSLAGWGRHSGVIASLDLARRPEHAAAVTARPWDLLIVDEAHRLKSRTSRSWQLVNGIQRKYLLLLTATPIQNSLEELYNLVTLLRPGQLATYSQFRRAFFARREGRAVRNGAALRALLAPVLVRTPRSAILLPFPRREVRTVTVVPGPGEARFLLELEALLREAYAALPPRERNPLPFVVLLREAASHPAQAAASLRRLACSPRAARLFGDRQRLAALARAAAALGRPARVEALLRRVAEALETGRHLLVFTEFRTTQAALQEALRAASRPVHLLHGGLPAAERPGVIDRFREEGGVLVSTDAGGLGLNLQFCHRVVNYDLPWNPLRVEQRVGRVHRLGQRRTVVVENLVSQTGIEAYVYRLLAEKLRLFDEVVGGGLELFPGDPAPHGLERALGRLVLSEAEPARLADRLEALGARLAAARERALAAHRLTRELLDDEAGEEAARA